MEIRSSNNSLIGNAFDAMREPLGMFEMREYIRRYGNGWWRDGVHGHLYEDQRRDVKPAEYNDVAGRDMECIDSLDILLMLRLIIQSWRDVFVAVLDRRSQTWARELIDTRNAWAHSTGEGFDDEDTKRALDTMARLMEQIDPETATAIRDYYREFAARDLLEPVAHQRHAEQEERNAAEERDDIGNTHIVISRWFFYLRPIGPV